jgi:serine/threonine protein kinase/tetratricopeptide (TPR) repeat protein
MSELSYERALDQVCTEFEEMLRYEPQPEILNWVKRVPNSLQDRIITELIIIEVEVMSISGRAEGLDYYLAKFPEAEGAVREAFQQLQHAEELRPPRPNAGERYELRDEIGRGGMGVIYSAFDHILKREIAIKVLHEQLQHDPNAVLRFEREPQVCGGLQHPSIVPIYDSGYLPDGRPFYAMKIIRGKTLAELIDEPCDDPSRSGLLEVFRQVCHAIAFTHRNGIIHRDLKPSNIMVGDFGEVYVMDWGLAGYMESDTSSPNEVGKEPQLWNESELTFSGALLGTPRYLPPESRLGGSGVTDTRGDVYGLGAILCEIFIHRTPNEASSLRCIGTPPTKRIELDTEAAPNRPYHSRSMRMSRIARDSCEASTVPYPVEHDLSLAHVDPQLIAVILKSVAPQPTSRWFDGAEVAAALDGYLSSAERRASEANLWASQAEMRSQVSQLRWRQLTGLFLVSFVAAVFGIWIVQETRLQNREQEIRFANAISEAQQSFIEAVESKSLAHPFWLQAREQLKRAMLFSNETLPEDARSLASQIEFFGVLSESSKLDTDVEQNVFVDGQSLESISNALLKLNIETEKTSVQNALSRLSALPDAGRGILANQLYGAIRFEIPALSDWWVEFIVGLEALPENQNILLAIRNGELAELTSLADEIDISQQQPQAICALAQALSAGGEHSLARAEGLLRKGQLAHPADFWLNTELAIFISQYTNSNASEIHAYYAAAMASAPSPGAKYNVALGLANCGRFENASEVLANLLDEHPNYHRGIELLAQCYEHMGEHLKSEKLWQRAILVARPNLEDRHELANSLYESARYEDAAKVLWSVITDDMANEVTYHALSNVNHANRLSTTAIEVLKIGIESFPRTGILYKRLAELYVDLCRYDEAEAAILLSLQYEPNDIEPYILMSRILREQGKVQDAIHWCQVAIELSPEHPEWQYDFDPFLIEAQRILELQLATIDSQYMIEDMQLQSDQAAEVAVEICFPAGQWRAGLVALSQWMASKEESNLNGAQQIRLSAIVANALVSGVSDGTSKERLKELVVELFSSAVKQAELDFEHLSPEILSLSLFKLGESGWHHPYTSVLHSEELFSQLHPEQRDRMKANWAVLEQFFE